MGEHEETVGRGQSCGRRGTANSVLQEWKVCWFRFSGPSSWSGRCVNGRVVYDIKSCMCRKTISGLLLSSCRLNLVIGDVYEWVEKMIWKLKKNEMTAEDKYDVVIMDICDPTEGYGPARL